MLYTQPQCGPLEIDWGNPITRGLLFLTIQQNPRDLVSGVQGAPGGAGYTRASGPPGIGASLASNTSSITFEGSESCNAIGGITCLALGIFTGTSADRSAISKAASNGGTNTPFDFGIGTSGKLRLGRANAGYRVWVSSVATTQNVPQVIAATQISDISSPPKFYLNGQLDSGAAASIYGGVGTGAAAGNVAPVRAQNRGDLSTPFGGTLFLAGVWGRVLTHAEIASLSANPWQVIADEDECEEEMMYSAASAPAGNGATHFATLSPVAAASAGAASVKATSAITLAGLAPLASGAVNASAASTITLAGIVAAATGAAMAAAASTAALVGVVSTAAGAAQVRAASTVTLGSLIATATGTAAQAGVNSGASSVALGAVIAPSAGTVRTTGQSSTALGSLLAAGSGAIKIFASSGGQLGPVIGIATGRTLAPERPSVPASRTVVFQGGTRVVAFDGGIRTVAFHGGTRTVRF